MVGPLAIFPIPITKCSIIKLFSQHLLNLNIFSKLLKEKKTNRWEVSKMNLFIFKAGAWTHGLAQISQLVYYWIILPKLLVCWEEVYKRADCSTPV